MTDKAQKSECEAIINSLASQIRRKRQEIMANCDSSMNYIDQAVGSTLDAELKKLKKRYIAQRNKLSK